MIQKQKRPSVGVAVITHTAKQHLQYSLPPILQSPLKPRVVVVNSSSQDGTVEEAERLGAETLVIPRSEFNHGSTRERARKHLNTDIVVMLTPDAYALNKHSLEALVAPLINGEASVAYGRQVPHDSAGVLEAYPRYFNYPSKGHVRSLKDIDKHGIYTFFCSDTFSAYLNTSLDEIGGFGSVLTAEDTFAVAKLLRSGHNIAYVAEAVVKHSHKYTLSQEFKRHFDTGLVRKQYAPLLQCPGGDMKRGRVFVRGLIEQVVKWRFRLFPYAAAHIFAKWLGYQLGRRSVKAPVWWKRTLSSQDYYWSSQDFLEKK